MLAPSSRMRGVTKISSSALLSVRCLLLNSVAGNRDVAQERHLVDRLATLRLVDTAEHNRLTVFDEHLRLDRTRVDTRYGATEAARRDDFADAVLVNVRSMMMLLSGVICGVTVSSRTAFLNWIVVAPDEADCWYGISTPCLIEASFWFAVMTRGVDTISPRPSASSAVSSRSTR